MNNLQHFAKFMIFDIINRLPVDIYQTAKVSKILLMMEKGTIPVEYKGKSLAEINFDLNLEYAEENNDGKCVKNIYCLFCLKFKHLISTKNL